MAFSQLKTRCCYVFLGDKIFNFSTKIQNSRRYSCFDSVSQKKLHSRLTNPNYRESSSENCGPQTLSFETGSVTQFAVTEEMQFFRDAKNQFNQLCFTDSKEPYGPPLAILLHWTNLDLNLLKSLIETYGEKGFDILTVNLKTEQYMYPCVAGGGMNVVSELLDYLMGVHKYRPYIFHGFSIAAYIYGEILAQFSDHYEKFRVIINNVKGCLWDSPVDLFSVKHHVGKVLYPNNWLKRWSCGRAIKSHFKNHCHDSVVYWIRARDNFCDPVVKVPNVFFVSYTDLLSNPCSLENIHKTLECNGVPIYQKTWWDSRHAHHFEKYCYEYLYGMVLFFNISNLFPDECGKYKSSSPTSSLANLRLRKKAKEEFNSSK